MLDFHRTDCCGKVKWQKKIKCVYFYGRAVALARCDVCQAIQTAAAFGCISLVILLYSGGNYFSCFGVDSARLAVPRTTVERASVTLQSVIETVKQFARIQRGKKFIPALRKGDRDAEALCDLHCAHPGHVLPVQ